MRKVLLALAASAALASPALANEGRIEARGGVIWDSTDTEDVYGVALGYDFDLGETAFVGAELSGDKVATSGTKVAFGVSGRLGAKLGAASKLYATGGYTTEMCDLCDDSWNLGAGYELGLGKNLYGKVEYRHHFLPAGNADGNTVMVGLGAKF